ncbi:hypothetical protein [Pontibacter ramchanderi]|uniref:SpoIIAA-like protein n=1 Tax=Pontibacter ramchanderi TaxID=1179743 RepID=A0A2N3UCU4_9BACT|nr:hypothetical protein [Pontibacter ramchanderi]PKV67209.1 hypothetical protein BD749_2350 [Pontibacter ramchanderi]
MNSKMPHIDSSLSAQHYVARNSCYEISFDATRNSIHYKILGFWKNEDSIPHFLKDWDKALQLVSPGFTLLIDMRTMITHPQQLNKLHEESQQKMKEAGLNRIANVMPVDRIAGLQVAESIRKIELPSHHFDTCEAAQEWLDKPMA